MGAAGPGRWRSPPGPSHNGFPSGRTCFNGEFQGGAIADARGALPRAAFALEAKLRGPSTPQCTGEETEAHRGRAQEQGLGPGGLNLRLHSASGCRLPSGHLALSPGKAGGAQLGGRSGT